MISQQILELFSAFILISAFYVQGQAYFKPAIYAQAIQSILISAIAIYMGFTLASFDYIFLGIAIVVFRSFLITLFLLRGLKEKLGLRESTKGIASELIINLAFFTTASIIIYYLIIEKISLNVEFSNSSILLFSFILLFQGLFLIITRKSTIFQFIGFIEEENSTILFGVLLLPIPFLIEVSIFLDILGLVIVTSILTLEKTEHSTLDELKG
ncbi:hydrogenase [Sulfolobus tengchongensis]|uniref:Hydrogenase n=1 Tax=Sulfolobus tengchongensis TaxID=207809 RepID=A0AAX4L0M5_9CREN